ncbi:MAG: hypothetical protein ACJ75B_17755 [Flavisolibacter sp.]
MEENSKTQSGQTGEEKKQQHQSSDIDERGGSENASANRGGTTDMDGDALTVDRGSDGRIASGISTKIGVTGSDFDGQVRPE